MVNLVKNQTVSLSKESPEGLGVIDIGLGWDPVAQKKGFFGSLFGGSSDAIDLDASCVLLDAKGQEIDIVWFQQLTSRCGSVVHQGDNLTGEGDGDDEVIRVNLKQLPATVEYLAITVNSFRGQTFNEVENAFCRVVDAKHDKELVRFSLTDQGAHTGILIASLSRKNGEWLFQAQGIPCKGQTVRHMLPDIIAKII